MDRRQAGMHRPRRAIVEAAGCRFAAHGHAGTSCSRVVAADGEAA